MPYYPYPFLPSSGSTPITSLSADKIIPKNAFIRNNGPVLSTRLDAFSTTELVLSGANYSWVVEPAVMFSGGTVASLLNLTDSRIREEPIDKMSNEFRIGMSFTYAGGNTDGIVQARLVNPSGTIIDDDEMTVNVNGGGGTNDLKFSGFGRIPPLQQTPLAINWFWL